MQMREASPPSIAWIVHTWFEIRGSSGRTPQQGIVVEAPASREWSFTIRYIQTHI